MRIKYKEGKDVLTVEIPENKPELEEQLVTIDKYENHIWKINGVTKQIVYLQIKNATEEFGEIWLNELLGAQLLTDHFANNPEGREMLLAAQPPTSSILLPGQQGFSSPLTTGLF